MLESTKVPALTRAIDILDTIARLGPCSAATIIDALGIPKSTAYLLLGELRRQRFLSLDFSASTARTTTACGPGWWSWRAMRSAGWICVRWRARA